MPPGRIDRTASGVSTGPSRGSARFDPFNAWDKDGSRRVACAMVGALPRRGGEIWARFFTVLPGYSKAHVIYMRRPAAGRGGAARGGAGRGGVSRLVRRRFRQGFSGAVAGAPAGAVAREAVVTPVSFAPSVPSVPPWVRAGRRWGARLAQKGGRRVSFTSRPAPLPSRNGAMTPFFRCAGAAAHLKGMRQPPFSAPPTPRAGRGVRWCLHR